MGRAARDGWHPLTGAQDCARISAKQFGECPLAKAAVVSLDRIFQTKCHVGCHEKEEADLRRPRYIT
jgi:hypothetical protein